MKKYIVSTLSILYFSFPILAQENRTTATEGSIIMSEADITSLSKTLRKYMKIKVADNAAAVTNGTITSDKVGSNLETRFLEQQIEILGQELNTARAQKNTFSSTPALANSNSRDFKDLEYRLLRIQDQLANSKRSVSESPTVVDLRAKQDLATRPLELQHTVDQRAEFKILQRKMDSIQSILNKEVTGETVQTVDYRDDFEVLQQKLADLKKELSAKNETPDNSTILKTKFGAFNREILFANNSKILDKKGVGTIEEFYSIMDAYSSLQIVVHGFASETGSIDRNETISMLRTEAVKKALIVRGINPNRILTQYHGIDYNAKNEADARRVEISFLISK